MSLAEPPFSVVVPNYEGEMLLQKYFPALLQAAREADTRAEVIVVDDASHDGSVAWLEPHCPTVRVVKMSEHSGYGQACNRGVQAASGKIVFLINNDLELTAETFKPVMRWFEDKQVFGVRLGIRMVSQKTNPPDLSLFALGLRYRHGRIDLPMVRVAEPRQNWEIAALSGGACAVRRSAFLQLGGFDPLFAPAYWEDVDLSLRAARLGWKIVFEPKALCFHEGSATTHRLFGKRDLAILAERNHFLLAWKHLAGLRMWGSHVFFSVAKLGVSLLRGKLESWAALFQALKKNSVVRSQRQKLKRAQPFPVLVKHWQAAFARCPLFYN